MSTLDASSLHRHMKLCDTRTLNATCHCSQRIHVEQGRCLQTNVLTIWPKICLPKMTDCPYIHKCYMSNCVYVYIMLYTLDAYNYVISISMSASPGPGPALGVPCTHIIPAYMHTYIFYTAAISASPEIMSQCGTILGRQKLKGWSSL